MKCPDCGTEMKPLATSVYCPNDCDRIVTEYIDPEKTEKIYYFDKFDPQKFGHNSLASLPAPDPLFGDAELDAMLDGLFDGTD
jgi:hypothetical protein